MYYADVTLSAGASLPLDPDHDERAISAVSGDIEIAGDTFAAGQLLVLTPRDRVTVRATTDARMIILGGEPMEGPRYIWWNLVSSRKDRIEQAKADWKMARFDSVPGDSATPMGSRIGTPLYETGSRGISPTAIHRVRRCGCDPRRM